MDIQNIIILASASINLILLILYGGSLRIQATLTDLIEFSPTVCYICLRGEIGHEQDQKLDPVEEPHSYVTSHLVYIPDSDLR